MNKVNEVSTTNLQKTRLLWDLASLRDHLTAAHRDIEFLNALCESFAARIAAQSEMLGRSAEHRGESAGRVKELEAALMPFAAILAGGWDDGSLTASAPYPVTMGDLRGAARALAGTTNNKGM